MSDRPPVASAQRSPRSARAASKSNRLQTIKSGRAARAGLTRAPRPVCTATHHLTLRRFLPPGPLPSHRSDTHINQQRCPFFGPPLSCSLPPTLPTRFYYAGYARRSWPCRPRSLLCQAHPLPSISRAPSPAWPEGPPARRKCGGHAHRARVEDLYRLGRSIRFLILSSPCFPSELIALRQATSCP